MKPLLVRLFALTAIGGLVATAEACGGSNRGSAPTGPTGPTGPGGAPAPVGSIGYTISGAITAYRGGPVSAMNVMAAPYPFGAAVTTSTDDQGRYAVSGLTAQKVGLEIWSPRGDYATAFKFDVEAGDQAIDFVAHPTFRAPAAGGVVSGTIAGDEFIAGDDDFGGRCTGTPCKVVVFDYKFAAPTVELRLRWSEPSRQLALYLARGDIYFPPASPPPPADRYCCSSELVATYTFNYDFDRFAIGFEGSGGGRPGPADSQPFELIVRPLR